LRSAVAARHLAHRALRQRPEAQLSAAAYRDASNPENHMIDTVEPLVGDLIAWVKAGRPYSEVMDAWKTSCPRLPVWEEVTRRGLLACARDESGIEWVRLTPAGEDFLRHRVPA
jgi:hypothetical protein